MGYYLKYLKYKNKYLELKRFIGGNKYILDLDGNMVLENVEEYLNKHGISFEKYNTKYYYIRLKIYDILYDSFIITNTLNTTISVLPHGCINGVNKDTKDTEIIEIIKNIDSELFTTILFSAILEINLTEKTTQITTAYYFPTFKINERELTPLETIFEMMYRIYCFFGIENNILTDVAIGSCTKTTHQENCQRIQSASTYSLLLYRILATNFPYDKLSIYREKYGYKYKNEDTIRSDIILLLKQVRETKLTSLIEYVDFILEKKENKELATQLKEKITDTEMTLNMFFTLLFEKSCIENYKYLNIFSEIYMPKIYQTQMKSDNIFLLVKKLTNMVYKLIREKPCKKLIN